MTAALSQSLCICCVLLVAFIRITLYPHPRKTLRKSQKRP